MNRYAAQKSEYLQFSIAEDTGIQFIYETMSGANFYTIKTYIHFADNDDLNTANKFLCKVRMLYDLRSRNIQEIVFFLYFFFSS